MPSATDSYSLTGLDDPFGTSATIGGTNMTSLPTGGSTYGGTNIGVGSLPDTSGIPTSPDVSGAPSATDPTASGNTSWLDDIGSFLSKNAGNIANIGSAAYHSKQQQDANSKLAGQLRDQSAPILASGQNQLSNYQNLTDLQKKALESGVSTGSTLTGLADPLLSIGKDAFSQYTGGQLPAWQQAEIDQKVAQAKALARQSLGANVDSSTLSQVDSQIDQQAQISKGQLMQQNLASGEQAYGQGAGYVSQGGATTKAAYDKASADITTNLHNALETITVGLGPLNDSIKYEIAGNTALQKYMQDLYGAIAKASTAAGGGAAGGGIGGIIGGAKSIYNAGKTVYDKFFNKVTPPGIPAMVGGIPSPAPLPPPVLPPTAGPSASVGPEPFDANTSLYGPENGATPDDPTGTQPTDTTGTTPQTANTGASGVSSGAQLAEVVGATGAAAATLSALSAAAVRHGALLLTDAFGNALIPVVQAASTAEGAAAVAATSEALASVGATTAETTEIAKIAADTIVQGASTEYALSTAVKQILPAAAMLFTFALDSSREKTTDLSYAMRQAGLGSQTLEQGQAVNRATQTPSASNTSPEELAALYQSAGGMDTGWPP